MLAIRAASLLLCLFLLSSCGGGGGSNPVFPPIVVQPSFPPLGPQTLNVSSYVGPHDNVTMANGVVYRDGKIVFRQDADIHWTQGVDQGTFLRYSWHHMVLPKHEYIDVVVSDRYDATTIEASHHFERTFWAEHVGLAAVYKFGPGPNIERECFHMGGFVRGPERWLVINECELR